MFSDKQKGFIQVIIILAFTILGGTFLSPMLNNSIEGASFLGGFLGFLVSITIFPETIRGLLKQRSEKREERIMEEQQLSLYRSFTHSTRLPLTISILLFIAMIALAFLFDILKIKNVSGILQIGLLGAAFLWGLSGFLILARKEFVDEKGRRYRGVWAILNGVVFLLMGWGSLIFLLLAEIFKW